MIARSLATHGAAPLAARRLDPLRRAVDVFGFHLAALDLRQNSDVHEAVVAELLARARVAADYAALDEAARVALLARELGEPASAAFAASRLLRARRSRARDRCATPPTSTPATARRRCRTT